MQGQESHSQRHSRRWYIAIIWITIVSLILGLVGLQAFVSAYRNTDATIDSHTTVQSLSANRLGKLVDNSSTRTYYQRFTKIFEQKVHWKNCDTEEQDNHVQCADIIVPINWENPHSKTTTIHINRIAAQSHDPNAPTLFINPGGPGASGVDFLADQYDTLFSQDMKQHYTIVGFDPRGTGKSNPLQCTDNTAITDKFLFADPLTATNRADTVATAHEFLDTCKKKNPSYINFLDTQSVVHDLDLLRVLMNSDTLHYLGYSYGTSIGINYIALYPKTLGRIVLDGVVDPTVDDVTATLNQAEGFEQALNNYLRACLAKNKEHTDNKQECPFRGTVHHARATITDLIKQAIHHRLIDRTTNKPIPVAVLLYGIITPLYSQESWHYLDMAFDELIHSHSTSIFQELANGYLDRTENNGNVTYKDNSAWVIGIINCADTLLTLTPEENAKIDRDLAQRAPIFGTFLSGGDIPCNILHLSHNHQQNINFHNITAPNVLIVGTLHDPATPYKQARNIANLLHARLITYNGEGHTAYNPNTPCVQHYVNNYFLHGTLPKADVTCPAQ